MCSNTLNNGYTRIRTLDIVFILSMQLCYGIFCFPFQYEPLKDVFNAAQSGAMITDAIKHEFGYLLEQVTKV